MAADAIRWLKEQELVYVNLTCVRLAGKAYGVGPSGSYIVYGMKYRAKMLCYMSLKPSCSPHTQFSLHTFYIVSSRMMLTLVNLRLMDTGI